MNGFNFSFFLALLSANRNMSRVLKVPWSNYSLSIVLKQVKTTVRTLYINISLLQSVGVCQTAIDKGPLGTSFFFLYYYLNVIWNLQPSKQVQIFAQRRRHHRWSKAVIWNRHQSSVKLVLPWRAVFHPCKESEMPGKVLSSFDTSDEQQVVCVTFQMGGEHCFATVIVKQSRE